MMSACSTISVLSLLSVDRYFFSLLESGLQGISVSSVLSVDRYWNPPLVAFTPRCSAIVRS
jgi:hypothetical protein